MVIADSVPKPDQSVGVPWAEASLTTYDTPHVTPPRQACSIEWQSNRQTMTIMRSIGNALKRNRSNIESAAFNDNGLCEKGLAGFGDQS
jgi:hypothetical protein